jgi:hypothetical protein
MIKFRLQIKYALVLVFITMLIVSQSHASNFEKSLDKLLILSGLNDQLEQFPELMKRGMGDARDQSSGLSDSANALVLASIDQTILSSEIIDSIRDALRNDLSAVEAEQLLAWYESDLGKKFTSAEADSSGIDAESKILALEERLLANKERMDFAKRFDKLLGATDMNIELQKHSSIAIFSALMTAAHPEREIDISPFASQIVILSEQSRPIVEKDVMLSFIYAYQDIETNKLEKYETFLNQNSTKKFNTIVIESMSAAIEKSISKWATSLASIFQHKGATAL